MSRQAQNYVAIHMGSWNDIESIWKHALRQGGHGLGVSLGVYSISDLDQKIEAVTKLESEVIERKKGGLFGAEPLETSNPERVQ